MELKARHPNLNMVVQIGSVHDSRRIFVIYYLGRQLIVKGNYCISTDTEW